MCDTSAGCFRKNTNNSVQPDLVAGEEVGNVPAVTAQAVIKLVADLICQKLDFTIKVSLEGKHLHFTSYSDTQNSPSTWAEVVAEGGREAEVRPTGPAGAPATQKRYRGPAYRRRQLKRWAIRRNKMVEADKAGKVAEERDNEAPRNTCLLYTSPSPRDRQKSRMPSSA